MWADFDLVGSSPDGISDSWEDNEEVQEKLDYIGASEFSLRRAYGVTGNAKVLPWRWRRGVEDHPDSDKDAPNGEYAVPHICGNHSSDNRYSNENLPSGLSVHRTRSNSIVVSMENCMHVGFAPSCAVL